MLAGQLEKIGMGSRGSELQDIPVAPHCNCGRVNSNFRFQFQAPSHPAFGSQSAIAIDNEKSI